MATAAQWVSGARPRTLPAAVAPVAVGAGLGAWAGAFALPRVLLALVVALMLQIGVNYANDYSDGIKGTDDRRVGPVRLVGQQLASPPAVKRAALLSFALAALAGLALVVLTTQWWLLLVGMASIAAAWLYTGGPRPYGYAGLGEIFVFVFFGLVPVVGTAYVQTLTITGVDVLASVGVGLLSCAILVTNNLRDIPSDSVVGKRTLAVRLGDERTRMLYVVLVTGALIVPVLLVPWTSPLVAITLATGLAAVGPLRLVLSGATGPQLIPALKGTGLLLLLYGLVLGGLLAFA
ncbi:MAG: 1,4-dihydroxy-2-naphthoate polyprenyltransferase [Candidatus Nanopelagicales bacterium]|nr:1,4-dihydroxy-2-naphthoate polyprenyltransferase [Candidatus Nanopelagicales bacterium]MCF8538519.1 1,4-dihydroxy-2-naphthoate polyprenyltransferase [Candidatus Nanopelagicales bacterium]MCF8555941.1 1,4-dihydroxy-2-naphthoate polyprenyltransferase [Candidatus Nanopelagicales bacterium]